MFFLSNEENGGKKMFKEDSVVTRETSKSFSFIRMENNGEMMKLVSENRLLHAKRKVRKNQSERCGLNGFGALSSNGHANSFSDETILMMSCFFLT